MNKKVVIAIVIIVIVIIIGVVGYLIYSSNKKKKDLQSQQQMAILQQQMNQNPNMPSDQKMNILGQIAALAAQIAATKQAAGGGVGTPPYVPPVAGTPVVDAAPPITVDPPGFPLRVGSNTSTAPVGKKYVQNIQGAMNLKCGKKLVTDGKFGPLTQAAAAQCIGSPIVSWQQYQDYVTI